MFDGRANPRADALLHIVGGPPRVGKSTIARAVAQKHGIGWASVDVLRALLLTAGVSLKPDREIQAAVQQARAFFPYLRQFAWQTNAIYGRYLLEGVYILPDQVSALRGEGLPIRACFVGNASITPDNRVEFAANFDWVRELSNEARATLAEQIVALSEFIAAEADREGWPYVDMNGDFAARVSEVLGVLSQ